VSFSMCSTQAYVARDDGKRLAIMITLLARTTEKGSRTLVAAAVAGSESHGKYMTDAKVNDGALSEVVQSRGGKKAGERSGRN
jgi:hypothetical protein